MTSMRSNMKLLFCFLPVPAKYYIEADTQITRNLTRIDSPAQSMLTRNADSIRLGVK